MLLKALLRDPLKRFNLSSGQILSEESHYWAFLNGVECLPNSYWFLLQEKYLLGDTKGSSYPSCHVLRIHRAKDTPGSSCIWQKQPWSFALTLTLLRYMFDMHCLQLWQVKDQIMSSAATWKLLMMSIFKDRCTQLRNSPTCIRLLLLLH